MRHIFLLLIVVFVLVDSMYAQDTLPNLSVKNIGNTVLVSWTNPFTTLTTLNIQRSADSLKNFTTIGSILDVKNKQNGYADAKPKSLKMFYRVFIAFEGGAYLFSKSYRPVKDSVKPGEVKKTEILLPPLPVVRHSYIPSRYIYTGKDNNVIIVLKDAATRKYQVKFFTESKVPLFEINKISEPYLIIEKVNFLHAGMFRFEIYEDGILMEEHWIYIQKDGKFTNSQTEINRNNR